MLPLYSAAAAAAAAAAADDDDDDDDQLGGCHRNRKHLMATIYSALSAPATQIRLYVSRNRYQDYRVVVYSFKLHTQIGEVITESFPWP